MGIFLDFTINTSMDTSKVVSEKSLTMVDAVIITLLPFFIEMLQYDWL
jgi:hypothetical protein